MGKLYLIISFVALVAFSNAQVITANDSVNTGPGNINMVFYSLATHAQTIPSDTDWHIAVTVRQGMTIAATTIRINEANGVNAYIAQNADSNSFSTLDTTGWRNWWHLHDADTSLDEGALNSNRNHSNEFDFGWGMYDLNNNNLYGDSIFLIQLPSGELKKLVVIDLIQDTAFDIKCSNVDNTDSLYIHISLLDYAGKNFVYLNLDNGAIIDKEPLSANWDMQFLKYTAVDTLDVQGGTMPVAGIWVNEGDSVAKATGVDVDSNSYAGLTFSGKLNTIGWNWKPLVDTAGVVQDSLAYFIKTTTGTYYKLVLTGYNDSTGVFSFYQQQVASPATGINEVSDADQVTLFPNPANGTVNIIHPAFAGSKYQLMDISGNVIMAGNTSGPLLQLNTSQFAAGVYIFNIIDNENISTRKLVIEH